MPTDSTAVHLLHVFSSFAVGGAQVRFATIANRVGPRFRHTIIALDDDLAARERLSAALDVTFLPAPDRGSRSLLPHLLGAGSQMRAIRADLLLTYNWGAIEWALARWLAPSCPHVHVEDGFGPEEAGGRQFRRRVWTRRIALRGSSRLIVPSVTLRKIAISEWRFPAGRLFHIPNGVDIARYRGDRSAPRAAASAMVVGSVGALRPEKNLARLLRSFARVHAEFPARLVIVGDGPERGPLEHLATSLGIGSAVTFTGHLADPAPMLASFDLFALSSDTEQMPYSILEAMAGGLPIAATAVGDIADMVAPENRPFVVPADAEEGLAAAMRDLLRDPVAARAIGEANRARACREFDESTMIDRHAAVWRGSVPHRSAA